MATSSLYYLNSSSFASATAVFTDSALTTLAPDGWFSFGGIVREQVGGVLQPAIPCPSCFIDCDNQLAHSGDDGIYNVTFNTGFNVGAIIIRFNPNNVPDGFLATYDGIDYNGLVSPAYGWLQGGVAGEPSYIGRAADDCGISGTTYVLDNYRFQGGSFIFDGTTLSVTVNPLSVDTTVGNPGNCVMVIPKVNASPSSLYLQIVSPCPSGAFTVEVECPALLQGFASSNVNGSSTAACNDILDQTYYVAHVNGSGGVLYLYDYVFADAYGQTPLSAGFYNVSGMSPFYDWIQVDVNGVVIAFGSCSYEDNYLVRRCGDNFEIVVYSASALTPGQLISVNEAIYSGCRFTVVGPQATQADATFNAVVPGTCENVCVYWEATSNFEVGNVNLNFVDCFGVPQVYSLGPEETYSFCARATSYVSPEGVTSVIDSCQCPAIYYYQVTRCGDGLSVIIDSTTVLNPGDVVSITGYSGCYFQVVSSSALAPAESFVSLEPTTCSEVCVLMSFQNVSGGPSPITWTGCDDLPYAYTLSDSQTILRCVKGGAYTVPGGIVVTLSNCNCGV